MDNILFLPLVVAAMGFATAIVTRILGKGTGPVVFLLVFSTFSGYLNNLYDRHPAIHVARFALLSVIAVFWLFSKRGSRRTPMARTPLDRVIWAFFVFYALQMLNPNWSGLRPALLNGLIGLATHGFPILLFFIGREILRTPRQIAGIFYLLISLSIVMALYGVYQYQQGYDYVVGLGAGFKTTINRELLWRTDDFEAKVFRPVSFAPDAGTASSFYAVGILLAGALLTTARMNFAAQWGLIAGIGTMFLALCLTLVRSSMVGTLLGLGAVVTVGKRSVRTGIALVSLGLLVATIEDPTGGMLTERFKSGFRVGEVSRSRGSQIEGIWWAATNFPTGMGIGRAGPAGGRYNEPEDNRYTFPPESYFVCITFETGVVGLGFVATIFFVLLRHCMLAVLRVRDPDLHPLALAISVVLGAAILVSLVGPTLYAAPLSYLFWTLAGLLFRVLELETASRQRLVEAQRARAATAAAPAPGASGS